MLVSTEKVINRDNQDGVKLESIQFGGMSLTAAIKTYPSRASDAPANHSFADVPPFRLKSLITVFFLHLLIEKENSDDYHSRV